MGQRLAERIREILLWKLLNQEVGFFDFTENSVGALASRLSTDALLIRGAVGDAVGIVRHFSFDFIAVLIILRLFFCPIH